MRRLIEIPVTKAVLAIYEDELVNALPRDLYIEGLRRGKAIKRRRQYNERLEKMQEGGR